MRHNKKSNHLGRAKAYRETMFASMTSSLVIYKRINTTVAKAKEPCRFVESIITTAKNDTTPPHRLASGCLCDKGAVKEFSDIVIDKVGDRPRGYVCTLRIGLRLSDNASMRFIELVDFSGNITRSASAPKSKGKERVHRSRRAGGTTKAATQEVPATEAPAQAEEPAQK